VNALSDGPSFQYRFVDELPPVLLPGPIALAQYTRGLLQLFPEKTILTGNNERGPLLGQQPTMQTSIGSVTVQERE
jgi:hypothetical protein